MTVMNKIEVFRATLEAAQRQSLLAQGFKTAVDIGDHVCRVKIGRKYANVDVGRSGKYMVEIATEKIFGIKGYGVIHRSHQYGTLDSLDSWNWNGYTATPKATQ